MLPLPGAPSSSWSLYRSRLQAKFEAVDFRVLAAFWTFGVINNVFYVLILSAALDLVGTSIPKASVLLASIIPSLAVKLTFPYFMDRLSYSLRILLLVAFSACGMLVVAADGGSRHVSAKLAGIVLANVSAGAGEVNFLSLVHFYGSFSLAAWGSGTGGAGLIGAGAYAIATTGFGLSAQATLLASAVLPILMLLAYFLLLPRSPLHLSELTRSVTAAEGFTPDDGAVSAGDEPQETEGLLSPVSDSAAQVEATHSWHTTVKDLRTKFSRARGLVIPYMIPLFLVFAAEYTINQGVAPTLRFPLHQSPFSHFRDFYPAYNAAYQVGVFISRSSLPFVRIRALYIPSILQIANLIVLVLHAMWPFLPTFWVVLAIVFEEGLLGGLVYVSAFADIREEVPASEREFSLGAVAVADSTGICLAGFVGMILETQLCAWQVRHGRLECTKR